MAKGFATTLEAKNQKTGTRLQYIPSISEVQNNERHLEKLILAQKLMAKPLELSFQIFDSRAYFSISLN
ncbi:hypothetical protein AY599_02290 [Leptolyngbya valderiana BDU 20041]|nr:hypothetical protein AY599_02290 [Leptolyngbya valderiana BDU 20041]